MTTKKKPAPRTVVKKTTIEITFTEYSDESNDISITPRGDELSTYETIGIFERIKYMLLNEGNNQ